MEPKDFEKMAEERDKREKAREEQAEEMNLLALEFKRAEFEDLKKEHEWKTAQRALIAKRHGQEIECNKMKLEEHALFRLQVSEMHEAKIALLESQTEAANRENK